MSTTKQKWIDVQHPDEVKRFRDIVNDPNESEWIVEFAKQTLESEVCEDPTPHIRASPLFELSSIEIYRDLFQQLDDNNYDDSECFIQIYGHIRLVDDKGNVFTLFKLDLENAETVVLKDERSVILRRPQLGTPRYLPKNLKLQIFLKDRIRDVVFFNGWKSISFTDNISYDMEVFRYLHYTVERGDFSKLRSTLVLRSPVFQCAVLATVAVTVLSVESDMRNDDAKLTGKFCAVMKLRNVEYSHELFDEPLELNVGVCTRLCVLAVPAYSSLEISSKLKFVDGDSITINEDRSEFKPLDDSDSDSDSDEVVDKEIKDEKWRILVSVKWKHACNMLPEFFLCELVDDSSFSEDSKDERIVLGRASEDSKDERRVNVGLGRASVDSRDKKKLNRLLGRGVLKTIFTGRPPKSKGLMEDEEEISDKIGYYIRPELEEISDKMGYYIRPELKTLSNVKWYTPLTIELVEVFCVYISSFDDVYGASSSLGICGKINSYGFTNRLLDYYNINEMKVGILYPHVTDKCLMGPNFIMNLELEDGKGHQISRGFLDYDDSKAQFWFNKRVCSVIPGKCGYAAVYYTIFEHATQAKVKVMLMPENGVEVSLSGSIHGRYGNHRYSTHYQKKFYQSTLFQKGKLELMKGGDEIPLTKSMICVPWKTSLIVKIDFDVSINGKHVEAIKGKATFKPRREDEVHEEFKVIGGSKSSSTTYNFLVSMVWGVKSSMSF